MKVINHSKIINDINVALQNNRLPQSIIITSYEYGDHFRVAIEIALKLNCQNLNSELQPCYECNNCKSILTLNTPDVIVLLPAPTRKNEVEILDEFRRTFIEFPYITLFEWSKNITAGSKQLIISVDDIRTLKEKLVYKNFVLKNRVVIIWYSETMNTQAANALLKSLEEPTINTYFILTTENYSTLLPTITSRCQRFILDKIPYELIKDYLINNEGVPQNKAEIIAKLSDGSLSNAYRLIKDIEDNSMLEDLKTLLGHSYRGKLEKLNEFANKFAHSNKEYQKFFLNYVLQKFRAAMLLQLGITKDTLILNKEKQIVDYLAKTMDQNLLIYLIEEIDKGIQDISRNVNAQLWMFNFGLNLYHKWRKK